MFSAKQSTQELKGKHGKGCIWPSESQKAKALWAMKAAWDRSEEVHDPARKEDILDRTITRLNLCPQRPACSSGKIVGMFGKFIVVLAFGS